VKSARWEASRYGRTRKPAAGSRFPAAGNQNPWQGAIPNGWTQIQYWLLILCETVFFGTVKEPSFQKGRFGSVQLTVSSVNFNDLLEC
jgi:hypothetical protein